MNARLSPEQIRTFDEDGYLLVKDVVPRAPIDALMAFVTHVIRLETGSEEPDGAVLNRVLVDLKRRNPSSSSWIYQTILTSWALRRFFVEIGIEDLAMQLLRMTNPDNLGTVSPAFRFDIPGDTRNIRSWHQDAAYFRENSEGRDHLVAWIPTNTARKDNGSVIVIPGSHHRGYHEPRHDAAKGFASEQYVVPDAWIVGQHRAYIEAEPGDIAFIHMDLIHSSGVNVTEYDVRYTAQIRFNTINRSDYRPVQLKPFYPTYDRRRD